MSFVLVNCGAVLFFWWRVTTPTVDPKSKWYQRMYDPGAFKLDQLESTKPIFGMQNFTLLTAHMQHFPFPACREREAPHWTPNVNGTNGSRTLRHSSWMILTPRNLFSTFFPSHMQHFLFLHPKKRAPHRLTVDLKCVWHQEILYPRQTPETERVF